MDPISSRVIAQIALTCHEATLPATDEYALKKVRMAQEMLLKKPQVEVNTEHVIHGGMYIRTIRLAPEIVLVGALVKVSTVLIVSGKTAVFTGEGWIELDGYHVIPARAGRKQIFVTREETSITMIFPTDAKTVEQAEEEFTSEAEALMSRKNDNDTVLVTGA
jgi:hypothetical protein